MRLLQQLSYVGLYGAMLIGMMVSTHLVARGQENISTGWPTPLLQDSFTSKLARRISQLLMAATTTLMDRCDVGRRAGSPFVTGLEPHNDDLLATRQGCEVESIGLLEATSSKNLQT